MELLNFFESIRTPFGDAFFSFITHLGEETIFIVMGLIFFWCISKKQGYYLLSIGLLGTVINQFLKLLFRVPRPWVKDKSFTIVESARAEATGYSFPSGHTQSSVGIFGGIARFNKNIWVRVICIILCILVPISRMYLGVHTPADVFVSVIIALILIFGIYPLIYNCLENKKAMRIFFGAMIIFNIVYLLFVSLYKFPADTDLNNLEHGITNGYKMLGCILGLWISYEVDINYSKFDTKAVWWVQILKLAIGIIPILAIKSGLKEPLRMLIQNNFVADGIRYLLLTAFAGAIWPLTFKYFSKLKKK